MAEAITLTLSEEEARLVRRAVQGTIGMMRSDARHDPDRAILERIEIMLEAHLKVAQRNRRY